MFLILFIYFYHYLFIYYYYLFITITTVTILIVTVITQFHWFRQGGHVSVIWLLAHRKERNRS